MSTTLTSGGTTPAVDPSSPLAGGLPGLPTLPTVPSNPLLPTTAPILAPTPQATDPLSGEPLGPGGATTGSGVIGNTTPAAGSLINVIWEYLSRGLLIFFGFALIMLGLVALLFQSKTVKTTAGALATAG